MGHRHDELIARIEALESEIAQLKTIAAQLMTGPEATPPLSQDPPAASRRDLLRYSAAAVGVVAAAGIAASPVVEGADGGPVIIGGNNTAGSTTFLTTTSGFGLYVTAGSGYGLLGHSSSSIGTYGYTTSTNANGAGVQGISGAATGSAPGVYGFATSASAPAVYGRHENGGNAVRAEIPASSSVNAISLYALNYSSYTGGGPGAGGFAIYGLSARGHGLVGATATAGGAAVVGASNGVAGALAAAFYGPVLVGGDFTVVGGAKSAAVPHPDGSHRRLYCVESPESWFEDFGEAALVCGEASIALDPDFAAVVDARKYHVFLTGQDGRCDLAVSEKTPTGFRVKAATGGGGAFSWRVVAKRKDIAGPRFEHVEIPKEPTLPPVPDSVYREMPTPPDIHERMGGPSQRPKRKA